jgi:hypothetical protein
MRRLTYANVMSSIAIFLLLAGGTAIAAKQLGKKTVGAKQLKKNAVTTAKIKGKAVTKAKIADGAIDGTKLADGSVTTTKIVDGAVTGAKIAAGSTPFTQITARLRTTSVVPFTGALTPYPIGSYTQQAGVDDQYIASVDLSFAASCAPPRQASVLLLIDSPNPAAPVPADLASQAVVIDTGGGAITRRVDFGYTPGALSPMSRMSQGSPTQHTFTGLLSLSTCAAGEVNVTGAQVDVLSTK